MPSPATLTVDLNALAHNFHALEAASGVAVHPVVKADSYGLGATAVARRLMVEGARTFFVARAAEGVALRAALGPAPVIYVLDGCHGDTAPAQKAADLRPILNQPVQLQAWRAAGGGACGLQIDTGMSRLGFRPEDAPEPFKGLDLVMSHLACADAPADSMNRRQRDAFAAVSARYPGAIRSFSNSGGCFMGADFAFDAVRPGICLYGGGPEGRPDDRIKAWRPSAQRWCSSARAQRRDRGLFRRLDRAARQHHRHRRGGLRRRRPASHTRPGARSGLRAPCAPSWDASPWT